MQWATLARSLVAPESGNYIQQLICDWDIRIDPPQWRRAWELAASRHESLRAWFDWRPDRELGQRFAQLAETLGNLEVQVLDAADCPASQREQRVAEFLQTDRRRGFNLHRPPLWRLTLFQWGPEATTTIWTFHHALLDGRSHRQLWREVVALHQSLSSGPEPGIDASPAKPFREFLQWLDHWSEDSPSARTYWAERLAGFQEAVGLPTLSTDPDSGSGNDPAGVATRRLDAPTTRQLRDAARRFDVTLNNLVQAAWALALSRHTGVDDVVFGTTRACRHWTQDAPAERLGLFINTVPFRVDATPAQPVRSWLHGLRTQQLALRTAEHASAAQIRSWAGLDPSLALMRTVLMFEDSGPDADDGPEPRGCRLLEKTDVLTLAAYADRELTLNIDYSPRRHPHAQIARVLDHLDQVLRALSEAPDSLPLSELGMLAPGERQTLMESWQGRAHADVPPLHRVIETQVRTTPHAVAVEFLTERLSYDALNQRANQLARLLQSTTAPGARIAVILDRCVDQVTVWLAALKSGRVYAPLDPSSPEERLRFYLEDLQPALVITQHALRSVLPAGTRLLVLDAPEDQARLKGLDVANLEFEPDPQAAANLLYTSGSTGTPKAAINRLGGLFNFAAEIRRTLNLGPSDRVLQSSSTSFDASLFDLSASLQSGATLVLIPYEQLKSGTPLHQALTEQRITATLLTPSVMRSTPVPDPHLRLVVSAGEPLTADLAASWGPGRQLLNVCGPTECSVWTHSEEVAELEQRPTIGRLLANCRGYVLDAALNPVPVGVPGELYLAGASVGLGYWNRPELTAEKFLPDPFQSHPASRMYRTGDRVRWLADGRLEYLGRFDYQVKIGGVRVELGEIEAALRSHPAVSDAVVALHDERPIAWLIAPENPPGELSLRAWLAQRIPLLFEPAHYEFVTAFPQTRTGKSDRAQLLAGWLSKRESTTSTTPALSEETRRLVVETWNQTSRPYPLDRPVVRWIEEQSAANPGAIALQSAGGTMTYGELNRRANRVAHQLLKRSLKPAETVALRFDRSMEYVVAALGILKAGGAYVPLELHIPPHRQQWILRDCGARFALIGAEHQDHFSGWEGEASILEQWATVDGLEGEENPAIPANPHRLAYLIYTSGSTGTPKGVEVEHRSLSNLIQFYQERLSLTSSDRTTLVANPVFDASVGDLWPGLCSGATVLIPSAADLSDPDRFIDWLATQGATYSFSPTAFGELLLNRPWPAGMALRHLTLGGDTLRFFPPPGLSFQVLNTYGPTENTVDSIWAVVPAIGGPGTPPIGRPISNVFAYVLDGQFQPVPPGVAGELFLGGEQVARGYRNRPELTRRAFLPDPFAAQPGARMYRSGDRVRWTTDGELEFLGRLDDQIQIRGQRVELGEIESVLRLHPAVRELCCRPQLDGVSVSGVVAHLVLDRAAVEGGTQPVLDSLRAFLEERLPEFMVPSRFVLHDQLPITAQGKVDRAALSAMAAAPGTAGPSALPEDSLERALTALWHRLLPHSVGRRRDQSFHELGGDSLLAVKLLLGVHEITGRRLALSTFLLAPSLDGLCQAASQAELDSHVPVLTLRSHPYSKAIPVFCMYELLGDVSSYMELAEILGGDHAVYGVRSPALHDDQRVPESLEAAAKQVLTWIRQIRPEGPFAILGYSWGGLLAFEVARQCTLTEGYSPFCALFGTQAPPRDPSYWEKLCHAVRAVPPWFRHFLRDHGQRVRRIFSAGAFLRRLGRNLTSEVQVELEQWASSPLAHAHIRMMVRYRPTERIRVPLHLFRERQAVVRRIHPSEYWWTDHEPDGGWHRWAGAQPEVTWLDGQHETVLKPPQVNLLATTLRGQLASHPHPAPTGQR